MAVVSSVDEHLPLLLAGRIEILRDFFEDGAVETFGDDAAVEIFDIEIQLVAEDFAVQQLAGDGIVKQDGVAGAVVDAFDALSGFDHVGRVVIDEVACDDGFTIGVFEHGLAENLCGLERRRGGETDFHGVEIIDDGAVFALVIALIAVEQIVA